MFAVSRSLVNNYKLYRSFSEAHIARKAITVYTFLVLVLCWNPPGYIAIPIIACTWIFTALVVGIPNAIHRHDVYYGQTGLCTFINFWH